MDKTKIEVNKANDSEQEIIKNSMPSSSFTYEEAENVFTKIISLHTSNNIEQQKILKYDENNKNESKKNSEFFPSRRNLAEQLFSSIPKEEIVDFYLNVVSNVEEFKKLNPMFKNWCLKSAAGFEHIFIQSFLLWIIDCRNNYRNNKKENVKFLRDQNNKQFKGVLLSDESFFDFNQSNIINQSTLSELNDSISSIDLAKNEDENESKYVIITSKQLELILRQLISLPCSLSLNLWNLAYDALLIGKYSSTFIYFVNEMSEEGKVSFHTYEFVLCNQKLASLINNPEFVIKALLLGPLKGSTVEAFALNRENEFRNKLKVLLVMVEGWTKNVATYLLGLETFAKTSRSNQAIPSFASFVTNVTNLMQQLRRDQILFEPISWGWAHTSVRRAAHRFYVENTWKEEQLNDLIQTVISQRPAIKHSIIKLLKQVYYDDEAARKWQRFCPTQSSRIHMSTDFEKINFHKATEGCLSIPSNVQIFFVNTVLKLMFVENELIKCENSDFPVVGLDSEWSPYVSSSRASILQIAFNSSIYLLDMDALRMHKRLAEFIDRLFSSQKVLKIGYQFTDDLIKLRESVKNCFSLYQPKSLICMGKLVTQLLLISKSTVNFDTNEFFSLNKFELNSLSNDNENNEFYIDDDGENSLNVSEINQKQEKKFEINGNVDCNIDSDNSSSENNRAEIEEDLTNISTLNESETNPYTIKAQNQKEKNKKKKPKGPIDVIKRMGLSSLCNHMLGLPLDKSEQCSVWDRRPLRHRQIRYAALDAYCILELYKKCQKWAKKLNIELTDLSIFSENYCTNLPLFWDASYLTTPQKLSY